MIPAYFLISYGIFGPKELSVIRAVEIHLKPGMSLPLRCRIFAEIFQWLIKNLKIAEIRFIG